MGIQGTLGLFAFLA